MTTTWMYQIRYRQSGWARAWVTSDGCLSIMSDWGNYAYWWGGDNGDHRAFLSRPDSEHYVADKLAGGRTEVDHDATVKGIKERICRHRREGRLDSELARKEWDHLEGIDFESERDMWIWYDGTSLDDACEVLVHRRPLQLQMFMKNCWPLLVVEMRRDLMGQAAQGWFTREVLT